MCYCFHMSESGTACESCFHHWLEKWSSLFPQTLVTDVTKQSFWRLSIQKRTFFLKLVLSWLLFAFNHGVERTNSTNSDLMAMWAKKLGSWNAAHTARGPSCLWRKLPQEGHWWFRPVWRFSESAVRYYFLVYCFLYNTNFPGPQRLGNIFPRLS